MPTLVPNEPEGLLFAVTLETAVSVISPAAARPPSAGSDPHREENLPLLMVVVSERARGPRWSVGGPVVGATAAAVRRGLSVMGPATI